MINKKTNPLSQIENTPHTPFNFKRLLCRGPAPVQCDKGDGDIGHGAPVVTFCCKRGVNESDDPPTPHVAKSNEIFCGPKTPYPKKKHLKKFSKRCRPKKNVKGIKDEAMMPNMMEHFIKYQAEFNSLLQGNEAWNPVIPTKVDEKICKSEFYRKIGFTQAPSCQCTIAQRATGNNECYSYKQNKKRQDSIYPCRKTNYEHSSELYHSLLAHFNNFCDERLIKNGFVYKSSQREKYRVRKLSNQAHLEKSHLEDNVKLPSDSKSDEKSWDHKRLGKMDESFVENSHSNPVIKAEKQDIATDVKVKFENETIPQIKEPKSEGNKKTGLFSYLRWIPRHAVKGASRGNETDLKGQTVPIGTSNFSAVTAYCFSAFVNQTPEEQPVQPISNKTEQSKVNSGSDELHTSRQPKLTMPMRQRDRRLLISQILPLFAQEQSTGSEWKIDLPDDFDTTLLEQAVQSKTPIEFFLEKIKRKYFIFKSYEYYQVTLTPRGPGDREQH